MDLGFLPGDWKTLVTAGMAGAVVSATMEWNGWLPALRKVIVGGLCAVYLSPLAVPLLTTIFSFLKVESAALRSVSLSGFIMGVTGIILIEIIMKVLKIKRDNMGEKS